MYRFPRSLALDFLHRLSNSMGANNLCPEVPLTIQFCSGLNFYASGTYQLRVGFDAFAFLSQTLVSRCVQLSYIFATKLMDEFVRFPRYIEEIEALHAEMQAYAECVLSGSICNSGCYCVT